MAASLEIHDLFDAGQVQVRLVEASGEARETAPVGFGIDLSEEERGALDRYHTDFRRGAARQESLRSKRSSWPCATWGRLLFESVFGADSEGRALLDEVMGRDERGVLAIVFSGDRSSCHCPGSLMNDPSLGYFINGLVGVVRQSSPQAPAGDAEGTEEDTLHVLMLSPSPLTFEAPSSGPLMAEPAAAGASLADANGGRAGRIERPGVAGPSEGRPR